MFQTARYVWHSGKKSVLKIKSWDYYYPVKLSGEVQIHCCWRKNQDQCLVSSSAIKHADLEGNWSLITRTHPWIGNSNVLLRIRHSWNIVHGRGFSSGWYDWKKVQEEGGGRAEGRKKGDPRASCIMHWAWTMWNKSPGSVTSISLLDYLFSL